MTTTIFEKKFPSVFAALAECRESLPDTLRAGWVFVRFTGRDQEQLWTNIPVGTALALRSMARPHAARCFEAAGCEWAYHAASGRVSGEYEAALMVLALYRSGTLSVEETRERIEQVPAPLDWRRVRLYAVQEEPIIDTTLAVLGS